jgi:hypothetical protein
MKCSLTAVQQRGISAADKTYLKLHLITGPHVIVTRDEVQPESCTEEAYISREGIIYQKQCISALCWKGRPAISLWHEFNIFLLGMAKSPFKGRGEVGNCRLNKNLQNGERCEQRERRFTVNIRCRDVALENIQVTFTVFRKIKFEDKTTFVWGNTV